MYLEREDRGGGVGGSVRREGERGRKERGGGGGGGENFLKT